jgi:hypothetical protein
MFVNAFHLKEGVIPNGQFIRGSVPISFQTPLVDKRLVMKDTTYGV